MQRVNVYIDGFNFYNGLSDSRWKKYYWLDIAKMCEELVHNLNSSNRLNLVYYFSAPPHQQEGKRKRQERFFIANQQNRKFQLVLGYHKDKSKTCNRCSNHIPMSEEKQTDVNIALHMLSDAVINQCDLSILISGDTDLIPIIKSIKQIKKSHRVMVFFPPSRKTHSMIDYVDGWRDLQREEAILKKCVFPKQVKLNKPDGVITHIEIPQKWVEFQYLV